MRLAQGLLDSEDGWMQASPLCPASTTDLWPRDEYGSREKIADDELTRRLREIAMTIDVPAGWRTFCARVTCYTWKNDYDLRLWWEQARNDLILRRSQCPMCRNGRSFFWWLSDCVEPELSAFVSGVFVGGRQRLHYDHFEIKPPKEWRELLGWAPELRNPLQWGHCGVPVARYDRRHGPLRDAPHGPHCRQPVVVRWLITDEAFQEVERVVGAIRLRDELAVHDFKER